MTGVIRRKMLCLVVLAGILFAWSDAHAEFYVIAAGSGGKSLGNVVTVAKENGDFADPATALDSITDASSTNPYLVVIGPGVYTLSSKLYMKDYVSVTGSGPNCTILEGAFSGSFFYSSESHAVEMADHMTLSNLQIKNTGGDGTYSIGVYLCEGLDTTFRNVLVDVVGNSIAYGIYNDGTDDVSIGDCEIKAHAAGTTRGISTVYGDTLIVDSYAEAHISNSANGSSTGIYTHGSGGRAYVRRSTVKASREELVNGTPLKSSENGQTYAVESTLKGGSVLEDGGGSVVDCIYCDNGLAGPYSCN